MDSKQIGAPRAQAQKSAARMTRREKAALLSANGMGVHEIAAALDVTAETVRRDLATAVGRWTL